MCAGILTMKANGLARGVRVFEALHFQTYNEPIRLFILSFFTPIVKDELTVLKRRTAVELPALPRITYSFC